MYALTANVISDKALRTGAKVWILYIAGSWEHVKVHGMSKGGRYVTKYIAMKRLKNVRVAWAPEHIQSRIINWCSEDKEHLQKRMDNLLTDVFMTQRWHDENRAKDEKARLIKESVALS